MLVAILPIHASRGSSPEAMTEVWEPVPPVIDSREGQRPSDAIVLFDGSTLDAWEPVNPRGRPWQIEGGALVIPSGRPGDLRTRQIFGDLQLHLEWRTPASAQGEGQDRGNSGIFFMGLYELQVLDSYHNKTYVNGQAGAVYKEHAPLVNASRPPGVWQSYDVIFVAPRFDTQGKLSHPARITAFQNGVLIQLDVELTGPTPNGATFHQATLPAYFPHAPELPLVLQDHSCPVAYRNIWVRSSFCQRKNRMRDNPGFP